MISIKNLYKSFGKLKVLKGVDLEVNKGGVFAVLGPNGSGKTTLIKSVLGMVKPDKGDILCFGTSIKNNWKYRKDIDYLPQIANFPTNLTVSELINMIKNLRDEEAQDSMLIELFGLGSFLNSKLGTLSGGTKQKVNLVLAFMFNSPLMVLDEPTTGLDPVSLIHLKDLIRKKGEEGKTIIITSHIMSFVEEMADEIIFLLEGVIYFKGNIPSLKKQTNQENLERAIAYILTNSHAQV